MLIAQYTPMPLNSGDGWVDLGWAIGQAVALLMIIAYFWLADKYRTYKMNRRK